MIMQVARDPSPLHLYLVIHFEFPQSRSIAHPYDDDADPDDRNQCECRQHSEKPALQVKRRMYHHKDTSRSFIPHTVTVSGFDFELIVAWCESRVPCKPELASIYPVLVEPLKHVGIAVVFRRGVFEA